MLSGATSDADLYFACRKTATACRGPGRKTTTVREKLLPYIVPVKNKTQYIVPHPQTDGNGAQTAVFTVFYRCCPYFQGCCIRDYRRNAITSARIKPKFSSTWLETLLSKSKGHNW